MKSFLLLLAATFMSLPAFATGQQTAVLTVSNMDCAVCPVTVRKALERVSGVSSAQVDFKTKSAVVTFDSGKTSPQALTKATTDVGFPSAVKRVE